MTRMPGVYGDTPQVLIRPGERTIVADAKAIASSPNPCAAMPHEVVPFGPTGGLIVLDMIFDDDCSMPFAPAEMAGGYAIMAMASGHVVMRPGSGPGQREFRMEPGSAMVACVDDPPGGGFYPAGSHFAALGLTLMPEDVAALMARGWGRQQVAVGRLFTLNRGDFLPLTSEAVRSVARTALRCSLDGPAREEFLLALVRALVSALAEAHTQRFPASRPPTDFNLIHLAMSARDERLASLAAAPALGVLARNSGVSPRALGDAIKAVFGQTAAELVRDARLSEARDRRLAVESDLAALARLAGYSHVSNFTTAFRRRYDAPPAAFSKVASATPAAR